MEESSARAGVITQLYIDDDCGNNRGNTLAILSVNFTQGEEEVAAPCIFFQVFFFFNSVGRNKARAQSLFFFLSLSLSVSASRAEFLYNFNEAL